MSKPSSMVGALIGEIGAGLGDLLPVVYLAFGAVIVLWILKKKGRDLYRYIKRRTNQ